jgi:MFS family permease
MKIHIPKRIAAAGGIFIVLSGALNSVLGARIGALYYDPYPGGRMGHVGIVAGLIAVLFGALILFFIPRLYKREEKNQRILGAALTVVFGHLGSIFGALYLGTVGLVLCYLAGIWLLVIFIREPA